MRFGKDVCGQQDSPLFPDLADNFAHFHNLSRVQADGGFVQDQHLGFVQQRLGQADPLAHPLRECADVTLGALFHADHLKGIVYHIFGVGKVAQVGHELQIFVDGHVCVQRRRFGQIAHATAHLQRFGHDIKTGHFG